MSKNTPNMRYINFVGRGWPSGVKESKNLVEVIYGSPHRRKFHCIGWRRKSGLSRDFRRGVLIPLKKIE